MFYPIGLSLFRMYAQSSGFIPIGRFFSIDRKFIAFWLSYKGVRNLKMQVCIVADKQMRPGIACNCANLSIFAQIKKKYNDLPIRRFLSIGLLILCPKQQLHPNRAFFPNREKSPSCLQQSLVTTPAPQ